MKSLRGLSEFSIAHQKLELSDVHGTESLRFFRIRTHSIGGIQGTVSGPRIPQVDHQYILDRDAVPMIHQLRHEPSLIS